MSLAGAITFDILAIAKTRAGADQAIRDADRVEQAWTGGAKRMGSTLRGLETVITAVFAGAAVKAAVSAIKEIEEGADSLIIRYQMTREEVERLEPSLERVFRTGVASMDEVAASAGRAYRNYGLTGKALEDYTYQQLKLAKYSGNVSQSLQEQTVIFDAWGLSAEDNLLLMDKLLLASGRSGVPLASLTSEYAESSAMLRQWGYDADEALVITANLGKAHIDVSSVLQAFKQSLGDVAEKERELAQVREKAVDLTKDRRSLERDLVEAQLRLRNAEGSEEYLSAVHRLEEIKEALQENREETEKTTKQQTELSAALEKTARGSLAEYVDKIKAAKTETDAVEIAAEAFGWRQAPEMARAIRGGAFDAGSLDLSGAKGTVSETAERTYDLAESIDKAVANIQQDIADLPLLKDLFEGAVGTFNSMDEGIQQLALVTAAAGGLIASSQITGVLGGLLGRAGLGAAASTVASTAPGWAASIPVGEIALGSGGAAAGAGGMSALGAGGLFAGGFLAAAGIGLGMTYLAHEGNKWLTDTFGTSGPDAESLAAYNDYVAQARGLQAVYNDASEITGYTQDPAKANTPVMSFAEWAQKAYGGLDYGAYADGGLVTRPTLALMGEAGPEYVVPANKMPGDTYNFNVGGITVNSQQDIEALFRKFEEFTARQRKQRGWRSA
jgi:hypothetical protein